MSLALLSKTVIGLMSGTSVDGLDAACCKIAMALDEATGRPSLTTCEVLGTLSHEFDPGLKQRLLALMSRETVSLEVLARLNMELGEAFGDLVRDLAQRIEAEGEVVDLVASHGQTVGHFPPQPGALGATLQLGEPSVIAQRSRLPVVADFRPADMAVGGQGAPLVPFADLLLFGHPTQAIAVQNIGGIANMTVVPPDKSDLPPLAFDSGPGNMVIDALMRRFYDQPYDAEGAIAASGTVQEGLLSVLLEDPYFAALPPKSTGRERYGEAFVSALLERWPSEVSPEDWVATATRLTVDTMALAYQQFVLPCYPLHKVVVGGGGAKNPTLMDALTHKLGALGLTVTTHEAYGIPSQYKEALAFALLGYARWFNLPANVPACTGASRPVVLGGLWHP